MININDYGFEIKALPECISLAGLESIVSKFIQDYALKYNKIAEATKSPLIESSDFNIFDVISFFEANCPAVNYELVKILRSSLELNLVASNFINLVSKNLNFNIPVFEGFDLFINHPHKLSTRLNLCLHQEASYYPHRKNFVSIWIPLFSNRNQSSSTLRIVDHTKVSEHTIPQQIHDFYEFKGHSPISSSTNTFTTFLPILPTAILDSYKDLTVDLGEYVLFDQFLIHGSTLNYSNKPALTLVARIFDIDKDHTTSSSLFSKPYVQKSCPF